LAMIPKPSRIKSTSTVDACRKPFCEVCGGFWHPVPHHIYSVGARNGDIPVNLISLCVECHTKAHAGKLTRNYLLTLTAVREGMDVDSAVAEIYKAKSGR
jgi:hypothetical protein